MAQNTVDASLLKEVEDLQLELVQLAANVVPERQLDLDRIAEQVRQLKLKLGGSLNQR